MAKRNYKPEEIVAKLSSVFASVQQLWRVPDRQVQLTMNSVLIFRRGSDVTVSVGTFLLPLSAPTSSLPDARKRAGEKS